VYEFIGLAFLLKAIAGEKNKYTVANLIAAAFFTACSFLTKQDAGGMAFMLSLALVFYTCLQNKKWLHLIIYAGAFAGILFLMIVPFIKSGFGYWFNHGQPPHSGRISAIEMINEFFGGSQMIKFYFFLILLLLILRFEKWKLLWQQKNEMLFLLLTLGILGEATVFQVTSYTPPDNNIFYHSFAIAFILTALSKKMSLDFDKRKMITICSLGIMLWWSGVYWKYIQRFAERAFPPSRAVVSPTGENIVNRQTFMINTDTVDGSDAKWKASEWRSFKKILMPEATIEGISRFMNMDIVKQHKDLKVLNMSELTPLAAEVPFALEKGSEYPLWFHLGVGMFNKQAIMFEKKIADKDYDLVLFEYVPSLNNFYPFRVRDSLITHYQKIDSFPAPRRGDTRGVIEVYRKPQ
jgi:hypothetical protein